MAGCFLRRIGGFLGEKRKLLLKLSSGVGFANIATQCYFYFTENPCSVETVSQELLARLNKVWENIETP